MDVGTAGDGEHGPSTAIGVFIDAPGVPIFYRGRQAAARCCLTPSLFKSRDDGSHRPGEEGRHAYTDGTTADPHRHRYRACAGDGSCTCVGFGHTDGASG